MTEITELFISGGLIVVKKDGETVRGASLGPDLFQGTAEEIKKQVAHRLDILLG